MTGVSVAALLGRMIVSLGVVIGLMFVIAKMAKKRMGGGGRRPSDPTTLQVLSRQTIGKGAAITLVRSGDRGLLLGVTEHSVSLLGETELPPEPQADAVPAARDVPIPLANLVQRARDLTVRRV